MRARQFPALDAVALRPRRKRRVPRSTPSESAERQPTSVENQNEASPAGGREAGGTFRRCAQVGRLVEAPENPLPRIPGTRAVEEQMATGTVKWFSERAGLRLSSPQTTTQRTSSSTTRASPPQGVRPLEEGARVSYDAESGDKNEASPAGGREAGGTFRRCAQVGRLVEAPENPLPRIPGTRAVEGQMATG